MGTAGFSCKCVRAGVCPSELTRCDAEVGNKTMEPRTWDSWVWICWGYTDLPVMPVDLPVQAANLQRTNMQKIREGKHLLPVRSDRAALP